MNHGGFHWAIGYVTCPALTVQLQLGNNDWLRLGMSPGNETEENQQEHNQYKYIVSALALPWHACTFTKATSSFFSSEKYIHIKKMCAPLKTKQNTM